MLQDILSQIKVDMKKVIVHLSEELKAIRTGRANAAVVEDVIVNYYGAKSPLKQLATILIPEPTLIVIQPWDPKAVKDVEQAIRESGLGFNPTNDGKSVRIAMPPLTTERRNELVKLLHKIGEESRVSLRNIRKEAWDKIQTGFKNGEVTEDEKYHAEDLFNKAIEEFNGEIEKIVKQKETDLSVL
jgi:ribosome recycling factor